MKISKNNRPLSALAKEKISEFIKKENLTPDDKLPSESQLADMLGVSRVTVREALAQLDQEGLIYKIQGKGTFLRRHIKMKNGLEVLKSPTQIMESFGYTPRTIYMPTEISYPDKEIKDKLLLQDDDQIITYRRKRFANDILAVFGVDSIPIKYFKGDIPERSPKESMLQYIEEDLGLKISYAQSKIIPHIFDDKWAKLLDIKPGTIFFLLEQVHFGQSGRPHVYSLDYFNTEVFEFVINRKR